MEITIPPYLPIAELAARMGRSRAWLSQRIHGHQVSGRIVSLSPQELSQLKEIMQQIAGEISQAASTIPR